MACLSRLFLGPERLEIFFEKVVTKTKPDVTATIFEIVDGG
jgi:hypothetical protein